MLASFISRDGFDVLKEQMDFDKRELESAAKTSTSGLQAEMLTMAQSFKCLHGGGLLHGRRARAPPV